MGKRIPVVAFVLVMASVFVSRGLAQEISPPNFIRGTITQVDPGKKEIAIRNKDGEVRLQWNQATQVNGSPVGEAGAVPEKLKTGMAVTVFFTQADQNRIANRIEVEAGNLGALKGLATPFTCGTSVC